MRTVIIFGVMAIVLFGLAAGASVFLTSYLEDKKKAQHGETAGAAETGKEGKELPPIARGSDGGARSRTGGTPETEQLVQENSKLHDREEAVRQMERRVKVREDALKLIRDDIKGERDEVDKLRKEVSDEVGGARDELTAAEKRVEDLNTKLKQEEAMLKDVKSNLYEADSLRAGNIKRVSGIADTAEPAEVAAIFERLAETGNPGLMTAAQILASMKDRRAAAVLQAIQDKTLAADLLDRMAGMKQVPPPGAANPLGGKPERAPAPAPGSR